MQKACFPPPTPPAHVACLFVWEAGCLGSLLTPRSSGSSGSSFSVVLSWKLRSGSFWFFCLPLLSSPSPCPSPPPPPTSNPQKSAPQYSGFAAESPLHQARAGRGPLASCLCRTFKRATEIKPTEKKTTTKKETSEGSQQTKRR